jgi:hypothetical protein
VPEDVPVMSFPPFLIEVATRKGDELVWGWRNERWTLDSVHDARASGRVLRVFAAMDVVNGGRKSGTSGD